MNLISTVIPALDAVLQFGGNDAVRVCAIFVLVIFAAGAVLRAIFGLGSALTQAVSASLCVVLVYLGAILLCRFAPAVWVWCAPLPFLTVTGGDVVIWSIAELSREALFTALVRMAILALLVNLLESFLPRGKKFLSWYLWRCVSVIGALAGYTGVCFLIRRFCPQVFGEWAMYVLLGMWAVILLTGLCKVLLTVVLAVVNPILGAVYGFFFSHALGKQFSKSILTCVVMCAIVLTMNHLNLSHFSFDAFTLTACGPACVLLFVGLYLCGRLL